MIEDEKQITEVEKILLICNLDPTITFRTMAKMIVEQISHNDNNNSTSETVTCPSSMSHLSHVSQNPGGSSDKNELMKQ